MRTGMLALVVLCAAAAPVTAQPASTAKADELFNEGRTLLEAGKFKEACAKFQASLDEADAIGTRMNLALCMEKRGRVYTALVSFEDTASRADRVGEAESARVAREHAATLKSQVPHLTVKWTPVPGERIVITRPDSPDVEVNGPDPVPLDPTDPNDPADRLTITATAPGHTPYTSEPRTLLPRANETITIPELGTGSDTGTIGTPPPGHGGKSSRRKLGIIVGASGLGLMIGGTIYAYIAKGNLDSYCRDHSTGAAPDCVYDPGTNELDTGMLQGGGKSRWNQLHIYSTTVFFVGVAALGAGALLYFTAPKSSERVAVVPTVDPDGGGLAVLGHF
jgi:hypothetical protein